MYVDKRVVVVGRRIKGTIIFGDKGERERENVQ